MLVLVLALAGQRTFVAIGDWIHDIRPEQRATFGRRLQSPSKPTIQL